jgi:hypothetical protein
MEKNTKILLGLGAVIAAYLILKPKKAITQTTSDINTKDTVDMSQSDNIGNNLYKYNGKTYSITRERLDYDYPNGMPAFGWKCVDPNGNECDLKNFPI